MDAVAYELFERLEHEHWWLRGRRTVYFDVLDHVLPAQRPLRSLDVGCGYGAMLPGLARYGPASGVDVFPEAVEECRRQGFESVETASAYELPAGPESYDVVTYFDCIEHLDDDMAALREAHRVLRPGGHVVASVPAYAFLFSNNDRVAHHKRRYTRGELRRKLAEAGFEVRKASYVNFWLFPIIVPIVLLKKLKERLFPVAEDPTTNLTHSMPGPANELLYGVFSSERYVLRRASVPFGHSIIAVAAKR